MKHLLVYKYFELGDDETTFRIERLESEDELHDRVNSITRERHGKSLEILFSGAVLHEYEYTPIEFAIKMEPKRVG